MTGPPPILEPARAGAKSAGPNPAHARAPSLYAIIGGLVVWFLVDILPHVHIVISWH